eukprot:gene13308-13420_t
MENDYGIIQCALNAEHCIPKIRSVVSHVNEGRLTIIFDQSTNTPKLESTYAIRSALNITPRIIGGAVGEWTSADTLVVAIAVRNGGTLYSPSQSESSDRGNDRSEENGSHVSGVVRILFREHGTLTLTAVDNITVLPLFTSARPISHKNSAKRDFRMKGVFATSGLTPVVISHQSIPAMSWSSGGWAVSLWLRLLQGPTGSYRTIFFKGDRAGLTADRTPSVWLLPHSNRLTLRVSTRDNVDLGAETTIELPLHEWSFLTFVFRNESSSERNATLIYSATVFVNGVLDVLVQYNEQDLSLWDAPLSDGDVTSLYSKGLGRDTEKNGHDKVRKESASVVAVEQALSLLIQARSSLIAVPSPSLLQNGDIGLSFPPEESSEAEFDRLFSDIASGLVGINGEAERKDRLSLAAALMQRWKEEDEKSQGQAEASCSEGAFFRRLDIFAEAAALGSGEALYFWAIQRIYGHLQPQSACGARASRAGRSRRATAKEEDANTLALLYALDMGEPRAMVPLAVRLLTGRGMSWMFGYTEGCGDGSKDRTEEVAEQWLVPKRFSMAWFVPFEAHVAEGILCLEQLVLLQWTGIILSGHFKHRARATRATYQRLWTTQLQRLQLTLL